jgi:hypothetical protein
MADPTSEVHPPVSAGASEMDFGGLHFDVSFRGPAGATLRVSGPVNGERKELLRFDDFVESPHYHVPADGSATMFDRTTLGDPLDWFVSQISDHLEELLTAAGFSEVLPDVDIGAVGANAGSIRKAMEDCVPEGYVRVPGFGLQRSDA